MDNVIVEQVPRVPLEKRRVIQPMREDLAKQIKMTGARFDRQKFRVTVRANHEQVAVPGGYVLPAGTHEITIDVSEIEALEALLETSESGIKAAEKAFHDHLITMVDDQQNGREWRMEGADERDIQKLITDAAASTGESVQSFFAKTNRRGIMPLTKIEPIGEALPPLEIDSDINVSAVATAVAAVLAAQRPQSQPQQGNGNQGNNNRKS